MWLNWRNYCLQFCNCWIVSDLHHFQLISAAPHFCSPFTRLSSFTCRHTHLFTCLTSKHLQVLNYYFYFNSWLKLRWLFSPRSCFKLRLLQLVLTQYSPFLYFPNSRVIHSSFSKLPKKKEKSFSKIFFLESFTVEEFFLIQFLWNHWSDFNMKKKSKINQSRNRSYSLFHWLYNQ